MTVNELRQQLDLRVLGGEGGLERQTDSCYIGDLLSWVMGRAKENSVWITVMGNINAVAVAKLADAACILLCENAHLDDDAKAQADLNSIPVLASEKDAYSLALSMGELLGAGEAR